MEAEKNISDQLSSSFRSTVLWEHYWQQLWLGVGIWIGVLLCLMLYHLISLYSLESNYRVETISSLLESDFGFGLLSLLCFTLPAVLGGLLRQPALAWLSRHARSQGELIGGSLLLFEALVVLATFYGWFYLGIADNKNLWNSFLACFFISLPWLLATAWASWCLAKKLALPARRQ